MQNDWKQMHNNHPLSRNPSRVQVDVHMLQNPNHTLCVFLLSSPQAMFSTDLIESKQERVAINGVEPQMIGMLVSYAYTSEVYISKANVQVKYLFRSFFLFLPA